MRALGRLGSQTWFGEMVGRNHLRVLAVLESSARASFSSSGAGPHFRFMAFLSKGATSRARRSFWSPLRALWISPSYLSPNSAIFIPRTRWGINASWRSWRSRKAARVSASHDSSWRVRWATRHRGSVDIRDRTLGQTFDVQICKELLFLLSCELGVHRFSYNSMMIMMTNRTKSSPAQSPRDRVKGKERWDHFRSSP